MAPTITTTADHPKDYMSLSHKIRKPIVEKLRRDRINNCIEELKALLGPQLLNQQPETKLEKADILEMTVCLIRQHLQPVKTKASSETSSQHVSRCFEEFHDLLSKDSGKTDLHGNLLTQLQILTPLSEDSRQTSLQSQLGSIQLVQGKHDSAPWRPW